MLGRKHPKSTRWTYSCPLSKLPLPTSANLSWRHQRPRHWAPTLPIPTSMLVTPLPLSIKKGQPSMRRQSMATKKWLNITMVIADPPWSRPQTQSQWPSQSRRWVMICWWIQARKCGVAAASVVCRRLRGRLSESLFFFFWFPDFGNSYSFPFLGLVNLWSTFDLHSFAFWETLASFSIIFAKNCFHTTDALSPSSKTPPFLSRLIMPIPSIFTQAATSSPKPPCTSKSHSCSPPPMDTLMAASPPVHCFLPTSPPDPRTGLHGIPPPR